MPAMSRRGRKALLVAGGLLLGLGLAEAAVRLIYIDLPSVANLRGTEYEVHPFEVRGMLSRRRDPDLRCKETTYIDTERNRPGIKDADRVTTKTYGKPSLADSLRLWVIGDSMVAGMGLKTGQAFGFHLAGRLATIAGRTVELLNLGMPGAGYCALLRRAHATLDEQKPGLLLVALFADDLEDRAMMEVHGKPVLFHDRLDEAWLQALVSRSYLANLIWFAVETRTTRSQRRFIDAKGQASFGRGMAGLRRRVTEEGGRLLVVILSPVGFSTCPSPAAPHSRCDWMARDIALMSRLLRAEDVPLLDLTDLWHRVPAKAVPRERFMAETWRGIHPDADGHRAIAEQVLSSVAELMR